MQAAALAAIGEPPASLRMMARKITSGDSTNIEAQAARHYWPRMMGPDFRRDRQRGSEVDTEAKQALARLIATDLPLGDGVTRFPLL